MLQAGPDGPDGIEVGYLPLSFATEPTTDPTVGGANPLDEHYRLVPQAAFCIRYISLNFNNPTVTGKIFAQTYLRQALQSTLDQDAAVRDIYQGYAYRQNGPVPMIPRDRPGVAAATRGRLAAAVRRRPGPAAARGQRLGHQHHPGGVRRPGTGPGQAGAGIPAGTKLSVLLRYVEGRPALTRLMTQFRDDAAEAGIELRLQEVYGSSWSPRTRPACPARTRRACGRCAAGTAVGCTTTRPARSCSRPTPAATSGTSPTRRPTS